tara:strand:- start:375 stop:1928 length:1554 start_codon:yes stop_codon:yes gene_type:complete
VLNHKKIAFYIFYLGLYGLSISIPVSKFGTSVGLILISFSWFLEWNWREKIKLLKKNKLLLTLSCSLFLIFVLGLFHSENTAYALKDLKIKAPILILPIIFGLSEIKLERKKIITAITLFGASGITASIIGFVLYHLRLQEGEVVNLRAMSPFISMIRLSLILCFTFGFLLWAINNLFTKWKWLLLIPSVWIVYYLVSAESLTGILLLPIVFTYFLFFLFKRNLKLAMALITVLIGLFIWVGFELNDIRVMIFKNHNSELMHQTLNGRYYSHNLKATFRENGYLVFDNFSKEELEKEWNKRSEKKYKESFNEYKYSSILMRYLSSKGLTKDSVGVSKLSDLEIEAIEKGVTNVYYVNRNPIFKRLHVGVMEIKDAIENNRYEGRSIASRFMYATTGIQIFKENFWIGVGTGDVKDEFLKKYSESSLFKKGCDKKSHNQYITIALSLGVFGFLTFTGALILLLKKYSGTIKYLFILSQIILLLSMIWEDTIETQAGATIFSLLLNVFLFEDKAQPNQS